jgi:phage head maturation protease
VAIELEARVAGTDEEIKAIVSRYDAGVQTGLSIGFVEDPRRDEWYRGEKTGLPLVVRRGARLVAVSLVVWPAYEGARVLELRHMSVGSRALEELRTAALADRLKGRRLDRGLARLGYLPAE